MLDVVTIGTATRDVFLESPLFRVVRDPQHLRKLGFRTGEAQCFALGGKVEISQPTFTVGGGAANTAVTFARQRLRTATLIKVGRDDVGTQAALALKREGVRPFVLRDTKGKGTSWSCILLSPSGERTILTYRGASEDIRAGEIASPRMQARWAYIVPGNIPFSVIFAFVRKMKRGGARIAMDPSKHYLEMGVRRLMPLFAELDLIKMNREEASYLTGLSYRDEKRIFRRFDELVGGLALMTDGPKGVSVSDGTRLFRAGVFREKKVVDRTGAGDAFGSGFVAGLMRKEGTGEAIRYAIRLGSANATSVVEHIGAQPGILSAREFRAQKRWTRLPIRVTALR